MRFDRADRGIRCLGTCNLISKGLRMCTSKRLAAIKGISDAKVEKMKEAARKLDGHEFVTGFEYAEQRKVSSHQIFEQSAVPRRTTRIL